MFEGLFDIKNDRRLSVYLYRLGLLTWCLYLVAGAPSFHQLSDYRSSIGLLSGLLLILAFGTHMVYESVHHKSAYHQKKKWLLIGTVFVAVLVYVMEFGAVSLPQLWIMFLNWLG